MPAPEGNKYAEGNDGGRPTDYDPECLERVRKHCKLGATDMELADFLEIHVSTLYRWKANHEEFCDAIKAGKEASDERVVRSLYGRAVGYDTIETKAVKLRDGDGGETLETADVIRHVPADATSGIFWLKNRRPDEWRDKQEVEDVTPVENKVASDMERARAALSLIRKGLLDVDDGAK